VCSRRPRLALHQGAFGAPGLGGRRLQRVCVLQGAQAQQATVVVTLVLGHKLLQDAGVPRGGEALIPAATTIATTTTLLYYCCFKCLNHSIIMSHGEGLLGVAVNAVNVWFKVQSSMNTNPVVLTDIPTLVSLFSTPAK